MLVGMVPLSNLTVYADETDTQEINFCGENLNWTLTDNGTLIISGTGPMTDYADKTQAPWYSEYINIKAVEIQEGVTTIGSYAFAENYTQLKRISLPSSLTAIGEYALLHAYITAVTLPEGLETIGKSAFQSTHITQLKLPESLVSCGAGAFSQCAYLQKIDIQALEEIPASMFLGCNPLTEVIFSSQLTSIGNGAFFNCGNLQAIVFSGSAPSIEENAFLNVTATVSYPANDSSWQNFSFNNFGGTLTWLPVGEGVFLEGSFGSPDVMHWRLENGTLYISGNGNMFFSEVPWKSYCGAIQKVVMSGNITRLDSNAFQDCVRLTEVVFNEGLESIMNCAFMNCVSLETITIPNSVLRISSSAFKDCKNLKSVTLSANLQELSGSLFWYCTSLESIIIPASVKTVSGSVFADCTNLTTVYFTGDMPELVLKAGPYAPTSSFKDCNITLYYPAYNKTWTAAKVKSLESFYQDPSAKGSVICKAYSGIQAPKLTGSNDVESGKPLVKWAVVAEAGGYDIYRSTTKTGTYSWVANTTDTQWLDSAATGGVTYYYKAKAIAQENIAYASDYSSVISIACKCPAPELTAESNASGKPVISWSKVTGAKKYELYRATSETGKYSKVTTTSKLTYTDSKAKAGTTYFYKIRVIASKSSYNSGYSNIVSCGVICGAPSVSVKVDANTGKPTLSWKKVDAATGYAIYRDGELLTTVTAVTYADTTAAIDTQYSYAVQALGKTEDLNGNLSKAVTATSGIATPKLTGKVNAEGQPILTWDAVEGAVKYEIYRSTKSSKSYKLVATVETLTYGDNAFAAGTAYYYKVKAIGAVSKSAESSYVKLTGKCATPVISAEAGQSGKPNISWEKVTGAKQYTVYRATSENGKYSKLGTTKSNTYEDKKASVGKTYFYKVIANGSKSSGNSAYSNIVSCSVRLAAPKIKSYGPSDTQGDPLLSWERVSGAKGYRILRKLPGETEFKVIKEWNETYFRDMDAPLFAECTYIMQTIGSKPEYDSVYTEEMAILSTMGQPNVTCLSKNNGASLTWYAVEGAVSYDVFVSDTKDGAFTLLLNTKSTGYLHTDAQPNRDYYYKVVAIGESGLRVEGYVNKLCIRCATPRVTLELDAVSGKPVLSWEAVDGATKGYEIYRATSGGKLKKLKTVKTLSFVDTSATPGGDYRYEVRALGSGKDYNSKWEETGYIVAKCAQPKATVKLNKSGDPVVSWKKVSGAKQYMVMYVDVTDFVLSGTEPSESYLQQHMQYVQTSKTSVTLTKAESDRVYIITMIAVPKNQECFSTPSDPVIVITE